jgi:hypothetical protein
MWSSLFYSSRELMFQPASRRLANWAFFNWMVAYNLSLLLLFLLADLAIVYVSQQWNGQTATCGCATGSKSKPSGPSGHNRPRKSALKQARQAAAAKENSSATTNQNEEKADKKDVQSESTPPSKLRIPQFLDAVSYNGLAYFLLANVFTGLVNLNMRTIDMAACPAVLLLATYALVLNAIACVLHSRRVKLKAW